MLFESFSIIKSLRYSTLQKHNIFGHQIFCHALSKLWRFTFLKKVCLKLTGLNILKIFKNDIFVWCIEVSLFIWFFRFKKFIILSFYFQVWQAIEKVLQEESQDKMECQYTHESSADSGYRSNSSVAAGGYRTGEALTFTQLSPLKCEVNESRFFTTNSSEVRKS